MKKPNQKQRLLAAFLRGEKLTTYTASQKKLTVTLPKRICDMQKEGYVFKKDWVTPKGIKGHFVYSLDKSKTPKKLLK